MSAVTKNIYVSFKPLRVISVKSVRGGLDTLESLGTASNFATQNRPADLVLKDLVDKSLGFTYAGDQEKALQREILTTQRDAIAAQRLLVNNERDIMRGFIADLGRANRDFLAGLGAVLRGGRPTMGPAQQASISPITVSPIDHAGLNEVASKFSGVSNQLAVAADTLRGLSVQHVHGGEISIVINGHEALSRMMPSIEKYVIDKVSEGINNMLRSRLPDVSNRAEQWIGNAYVRK